MYVNFLRSLTNDTLQCKNKLANNHLAHLRYTKVAKFKYDTKCQKIRHAFFFSPAWLQGGVPK